MDYSQLVSLVTSYSDRSDVEVSANMNNFILLVEAKINRLLRVREMAIRARIATITGETYYPLPDDFAGLRDVQLDVDNKIYTYKYLNPEQMNNISNLEITEPSLNYYTIIADQIQIFPARESANIEIVYYQKIPNLYTDITNWVSETYPDLYLAGIMVEIESFVKNKEGVVFWEARFDKAANALTMSDSIDRWSGTPLNMRVG